MSYSIAKTRIHRGARMKTRLEKCQGIDGAVCGAIERSMLTPYPDFGKATRSPCGHSKRARHQGARASPPLRYRSAQSAQHIKMRRSLPSIRPGEWKQTGPLRRVR
jgi:hypothetical protein